MPKSIDATLQATERHLQALRGHTNASIRTSRANNDLRALVLALSQTYLPASQQAQVERIVGLHEECHLSVEYR